MPERDKRGLEFNAEQGGPEFDRLLRSSLESYAAPDSSLAERVLARVAAEVEPERTRRANRVRLGMWWTVALPVAACLIAAIAFVASRHPSEGRTDQARVTLPKSIGAGTVGSIAILPSVAARHNSVSRPIWHSSRAAATVTDAHLPKLDVFPAPQPLTAEEKALVAYVAHTPKTERISLVEDKRKLDEPLTIAALEIQPLEPPEPQGN